MPRRQSTNLSCPTGPEHLGIVRHKCVQHKTRQPIAEKVRPASHRLVGGDHVTAPNATQKARQFRRRVVTAESANKRFVVTGTRLPLTPRRIILLSVPFRRNL